MDEALVPLHAALGAMPEPGNRTSDDPEHFAAEEKVEKWREGFWLESEAATMKAIGELAYLQETVVEAAMRAAADFREFLARGGSAGLPGEAAGHSERPTNRAGL